MSDIKQNIARRAKAKCWLEAHQELVGTEWTAPSEFSVFYACVSPSLHYAGKLRVSRFDAIGFMGHRDNLDRAAVVTELLSLFGSGITECAGTLDRLARTWPSQDEPTGTSPK